MSEIAPFRDQRPSAETTAGGRLVAQTNDGSFDDVWDELKWRGHNQINNDEAAHKELQARDPNKF